MVTDRQYDELVNTIQREFAERLERQFKLEAKIKELEQDIAILKQFAPTTNTEGLY